MKLMLGKCEDLMRGLGPESVDAIVCDPPYGLKFMNKDFDDLGEGEAQTRWHLQWTVEAYQVLKPGGYLVAFGGTRTYHRLACAVEDAGFELRDQIQWLYGSGFPKSFSVSKAIEKGGGPAEHWEGWGTALKPAYEPICVGRKPFIGTVAENVLEHGTGALNIDGCRVDFVSDSDESESKTKNRHADFNSGEANGYHGWDSRADGGNYDPTGRWPANVILTHAPGCEPVGVKKVKGITGGTGNHAGSVYGKRTNEGEAVKDYADKNGLETVESWNCVEGCPVAELDRQSGSARFFYVAKASSSERNAGLGRRSPTTVDDGRDVVNDTPYQRGATARLNTHPTVKPVMLMRYLTRLVCRPGGVVLDPFMGSGTTGVACHEEGFDFIGIEKDPQYFEIAETRIRENTRQQNLFGGAL